MGGFSHCHSNDGTTYGTNRCSLYSVCSIWSHFECYQFQLCHLFFLFVHHSSSGGSNLGQGQLNATLCMSDSENQAPIINTRDNYDIAVSCCALNGSYGIRPDCDWDPKNYTEAYQLCDDNGYRLCTVEGMIFFGRTQIIDMIPKKSHFVKYIRDRIEYPVPTRMRLWIVLQLGFR